MIQKNKQTHLLQKSIHLQELFLLMVQDSIHLHNDIILKIIHRTQTNVQGITEKKTFHLQLFTIKASKCN